MPPSLNSQAGSPRQPSSPGVAGVPPLAGLMRRYAFAYTAVHDLSACDDLMTEDYVLRMGPLEVRGRDTRYKGAASRQFEQFPGLGFTVHDLVLSDDRVALRFSEHGNSLAHQRSAAWQGVSLYRWDGRRLTECRVEQDYYSRRDQLRGGPLPVVPGPAVDPWASPAQPPSALTQGVVRNWLEEGGVLRLPAGAVDAEVSGVAARARFAGDVSTRVLDLFTAGDRAAFHAVIRGRFGGGLPECEAYLGAPAELYVAGLATVAYRTVTDCRVVTDRLALARRLGAIR